MRYYLKTLVLCLILPGLFVVVKLLQKSFFNESFLGEYHLYDFNYFDNEIGSLHQIIPSLVHYIIFDNVTINFMAFLSISSAIKIQRPDQVWIHCNKFEITGYYWDLLQELANISSVLLEVKYLSRPTHVYGQQLSSIYHASDVARISILISYGGIYLDTDTLILKSLDEFLKFEMVVGWPENDNIGTQVLLAHKDARLLRFWLHGYRWYKPRDWYYNAGSYPIHVLERNPGFAHRVKNEFGVQNFIHELFEEEEWIGWKSLSTIHTLFRHSSDHELHNINERSILNYKKSFGDIGKWILFDISPSLILDNSVSWFKQINNSQ